MSTDQVVDVSETPADRHRQRVLMRSGIPIAAVALIVVVIFAIAYYAERANRSGVLHLSDDLLATLQERIGQEVSAYLDPAVRATRLARDMMAQTTVPDPLGALQSFASSALKQIPQIDAFYSGDGNGNFIMVQRGPSGGTNTKLIQNAPSTRRVEWVRHDAGGEVIDRQQEANDDYDPRTREWYQGALGSDAVFWTDVYVFYTRREPGITASIRYANAGGEDRVFGVDITLKVLSDFLASLKIGKTGRAILMDNGGRLIAAPGRSGVLNEEGGRLATERVDELGDPELTAAFDRYRVEGYGRRTIIVGGRPVVSIVAQLPAAGRVWSLLMVVPEKDFTGFVFNNSRNTLWLSLILVGLAAAMGVLLVRQGLQTDWTARQLADRSGAIDRQIRAFAAVARRPGFFDRAQDAPIQELSVVLADLGTARRASVWEISSNGRLLSCEDAYEREAAVHIAGLRLARSELPWFFAALESNDEIQVDDAATDRRTSELHRALMQPFGSRSLYVVPARGPDGMLGAIVLEDAAQLSEARDIAALAANMLAARLQRPVDVAVTAVPGSLETVPASVGERSVTSDLVQEVDATSATGAGVLSSVAVMAVHFDDDTAMAAHDVATGATVADSIFVTLQDIASAHQIPYMKLVGNAVVAAAGLTPSDTAAVLRIADAAIAIREHCLDFFESNRKPPCFRIGVDCGVAIGSGVGRLPRVFNLWGKAVRTAEVMASTCAELGTIQVSEAVYHRLRQHFLFRVRGSFYLPGIGLSQTFILGGRP